MNDSNDIWGRPETEPAEAIAAEPVRPARRRSAPMGNKAKIAGALILGGVAGAAALGPLTALAASPAPAASSGTTGTTGTGTTPNPSGEPGRGPGGPGGHGRIGGGPNEAVSDASVVAKAIGISEADLTTALGSGQTIAAVAKAHNVAVQKVIDALVADGQSELDAAVKAGTMTQAQADQEKTELTQRATDQVNGTFGPGGPGGRGHDHGADAPAASAAPTN